MVARPLANDVPKNVAGPDVTADLTVVSDVNSYNQHVDELYSAVFDWMGYTEYTVMIYEPWIETLFLGNKNTSGDFPRMHAIEMIFGGSSCTQPFSKKASLPQASCKK